MLVAAGEEVCDFLQEDLLGCEGLRVDLTGAVYIWVGCSDVLKGD